MNFIYGYNHPKFSNKFIKQEQISNYAISRMSPLISGTERPELSIISPELPCWNDIIISSVPTTGHNSHFGRS